MATMKGSALIKPPYLYSFVFAQEDNSELCRKTILEYLVLVLSAPMNYHTLHL